MAVSVLFIVVNVAKRDEIIDGILTLVLVMSFVMQLKHLARIVF